MTTARQYMSMLVNAREQYLSTVTTGQRSGAKEPHELKQTGARTVSPHLPLFTVITALQQLEFILLSVSVLNGSSRTNTSLNKETKAGLHLMKGDDDAES